MRLPFQKIANIKVEELNANFKGLVVVDAHHHEKVVESSSANVDHFLVAFDCLFEPANLFFEEFAEEHGNVAGQYFENVPSLLNIGLNPADFLPVSSQREDFIQFNCCAFKHKDVFLHHLHIATFNLETSNFHKARHRIGAKLFWLENVGEFLDQVIIDDIVHGDPAEKSMEGF